MSSSLAESQSRRAPSPARRSRVERILFTLALLATVVLVGVETGRLIPSGSPGMTALSDADVGIIYKALRLKPTFLSTFAWWHEPWAGPFGYWRPLTSQAYWLEYHAFGPDHLSRWMGAIAVSHLCFTVVLAVLAARMTGNRWAALLTAYLFAGARVVGPFSAWGFGIIPSAATTYAWKNEPEVWAGICALGAMLLALSSRWTPAIVLAAASIGFKESGWLTWPLVFLALVPARRFRQIPRWVYGLGVVVCVILLAFRSSLSSDIYAGNHATHNVYWLSRYFGQIGGAYGIDLDSVNAPLAVFSLALVLLAQWRTAHIILRTCLAFGALFGCAFWFGAQSRTDLMTGLGLFGDWNSGLSHWLLDLAYLSCVFCLVRSREYNRMAAVLIAMILISALPVIASVLVGNHTLYLTYGLQCVVVALALVATAQAVQRGALSLTNIPGFSRKPKENT